MVKLIIHVPKSSTKPKLLNSNQNVLRQPLTNPIPSIKPKIDSLTRLYTKYKPRRTQQTQTEQPQNLQPRRKRTPSDYEHNLIGP